MSGPEVDQDEARAAGLAQEAAQLAGRIAAGDRSAEGELVARYRAGLVLVLRRWTGDRAAAEDLAQEALMIAIARMRERALDDPAKLGAFLRGTAHNLARADRRGGLRRQTTTAGDLLDGFADPDASPPREVARAQEAALVRQLIEELGVERDRELLRRFYIAGEPKPRICSDLGLDPVHFNRVLHRARLRLRDLLLQAGLGGVG